MRSYRLLCIDDNLRFLNALASLLESHGHQVQTAPNGHSAIQELQRGAFDVVITDFQMPDMDGLEVTRKVAQVRPGVPVFLLSGMASVVRNLPDAHLPRLIMQKPVTSEQLTTALQRLTLEIA